MTTTLSTTHSRWHIRAFASVRAAPAAVALGTAVFVVYWCVRSLARWRDLQVSAFDAAFFDQIVWNTSRGRIFETSFVPYRFDGQHVEPILFVFVPAYWLGAGIPFLLLVQAAVCGLAAVPLFAAARALGLRPALSAAAALAYLLSPYLHNALEFDFHPETMVALPAFTALWAFASGRARLGVACALSVLLFKEDAVFVALTLALCALRLGLRRPALLVACSALAWMLFTLGFLMPLARDGHPSDLIQRYRDIFGGLEGGAAVRYALLHPFEAPRLLLQPDRLATLARFFVTSPWALFAPVHALTLLPGLLVALLSTHPEQAALEVHYAAELVSIATIAGLFGFRRLARVAPQSVLPPAALVLALISMWTLSPASPAADVRGTPPTAIHRRAVDAAVALVPDGASVAAQSSLAPRLAHRETLTEFPGEWEQAEWVLVDRYGSRSSQSLEAGFDTELDRVRARLTLVFEADGVSVFRRTPQ